MKVGFFNSLVPLFLQEKSEYSRKILKKYTPCSLIDDECLNRAAFKKDFAVLKNKKQMRYLIPKYYTDSKGKSLLFAFADTFIYIIPKYYVLPGFPLLERMNHFLLLFHANGLVDKWHHDISDSIKKKVDSPEHENLSLGHLQGAFYLLIVGYTISVLTFVNEIFYKKGQSIYRSKK